jgi:uroporphyrinogen decarboxylase
MNKRDVLMNLLDPTSARPDYTPAAFFLHFDPQFHRGQAAIDKHMEFFRFTGMDFVKIQFELRFPPIPEIRQPADWAKMPIYPLEFYADQLEVVKGLVQAAGGEALVLLTLYSPFMMARQTTSDPVITEHIREDPDQVRRGMEAITRSMMGFVKECIRLGLDGFYTSTQGGEAGRFAGRDLFNKCIQPYDLALMNEINCQCQYNILHVCDFEQPYSDLSPYTDYPGQVVNTSLELSGGRQITAIEVAQLFQRPFMGGLNRTGVISNGNPQQVRAAVEEALRSAPERFILGADCTVPSTTPWDNLKLAIDIAHNFKRG